MKFVWAYLRQRRRAIAAYVLFLLIFLGTFALYHLPLAAVIYPAVLCGLLGLCLLIGGGRRAFVKHEKLQTLSRLSAELIEELPEAVTWEDADYQAVIGLLRQEILSREEEMTVRYEDMVEYYTVWAHQIKTPIAAMRLTLAGEDSDLARRLSEELTRIEQYVEMVLAFLRLDSETTDYVIRRYELDGIVRQAIRKFAGQFIRRKIRLVYEPAACQVLTDEKWLLFVVEQVLSNALKYTERGTITIECEAAKTLCIRDTGIGIAPEDLPRIFEKGYTGYHGREDKKASGLGLYLCRRICQKLGHTITAESVPGEGTVIRIGLAEAALEIG